MPPPRKPSSPASGGGPGKARSPPPRSAPPGPPAPGPGPSRCCRHLRAGPGGGRPAGAAQAAGPALVGLAEVAYQRDDLNRALEYVTRGITLCRQFVHTPPLAAGLVGSWPGSRRAAGRPARVTRRHDRSGVGLRGAVRVAQPGPGPRAAGCCWPGDVAGAAR